MNSLDLQLANKLNKAKKQELIIKTTELLEALKLLPDLTPCSECEYVGEGQYCMKWKARIPDDAIQAGCSAWELGIPF